MNKEFVYAMHFEVYSFVMPAELKFIFSSKATKIKTSGRFFFQILWPSDSILTLHKTKAGKMVWGLDFISS